ncbi:MULTISPECIES: single-stranded DNA-binding protein [Nocardia]|uniref:single-stranded DNA-binding protein n=1 Tax=Nocardia TaxID=1817 RepID=UPI002455E4E1|nr:MULTISPECIES: single-stranded DNA-binding protein [Nocardia]
MAGDTVITVMGNLTADVELRFTPAGVAVANFTVASTPRYFDRTTNQWKDSEALFLRCSLFREAAENAAESLTRGARVIVSGRLKQRSYQTREGEKRTVVELDVDEVGPSLRYATAKVTKRKSNHTNANDNSDRSRDLVGAATGSRGGDDDPWATTGSGFAGGFGGGFGGEEPPF